MTRKALLLAGALSSVLYLAIDVIGGMRYEGYSFLSQTISELSAIGAPTRTLVVMLGLAYSALVIAFGWGVRRSAGSARALRIAGGLLVAYGMMGLLWPFAPIHMRGVEPGLTDALHIALTAVTLLILLAAVGFAAAAFGAAFRLYSGLTLITLVVFGALTALDAPRIAANLPTPWVGLLERVDVYAFMAWVVVLSGALLRAAGAGERLRNGASRTEVEPSPDRHPLRASPSLAHTGPGRRS